MRNQTEKKDDRTFSSAFNNTFKMFKIEEENNHDLLLDFVSRKVETFPKKLWLEELRWKTRNESQWKYNFQWNL